jgi:hypothetical protein
MERTPDASNKKELEEIVGQMQCPKDCKCCESGLEALCKARDVGAESFLECMEEHSERCPFSVSLGVESLCQCPLRVYICRKLGK